MKLPGFIGGAYKLRSTSIDCQECINLYPEMDESGVGKNVASLLRTPGLRLFANLGADVVRGMLFTAAGRMFAVTKTTLWEVDAAGNATNRGTLNSSAGFVGMADNGQQVMLVDGPNGYQLDLTTNALTVLADFPGGFSVWFLDGVFVFNKPDTQQFYCTDQYATTIDPLNFASAEASPDNILSLLVDNELIWLFGERTTEIWYNAGLQNFPFQRVAGGVIMRGTPAAQSPIRADNTVAWLGQDTSGRGMFWRAVGYTAQRISTHAIEQEIATYPTIDDCVGYSYQQDGHTFGVWNFPSGGRTWVFDFATQLWHRRAYTGQLGLERHRGQYQVDAFSETIVSDYANGNLYVLDTEALNDVGMRIAKVRSSPYVTDELKNVFVAKVQLDMQMGLGPDGAAPDQAPPQCMLQWSDDGGQTWSNEHWVSVGALGERLKRAIWRRLGRTRQRVFKFTMTDDYPVAISNAFIDVTEGTS